MRWNKDRPRVPVDTSGNWLAWAPRAHEDWLNVVPFNASLEIVRLETGRSSKRVVLRETSTGHSFPMFLADLIDGLKSGSIEVSQGHLVATWTASKRGTNYGVRAV